MANELKIEGWDYEYKPTKQDAIALRNEVAKILGITVTAAMDSCAEVLSVSKATFHAWCYETKSDNRTMPNNAFMLLKIHIEELYKKT